MPDDLRKLIAGLLAHVRRLTAALQAGELTPSAWFDAMASKIAEFHLAAIVVGAKSSTVSPAMRQYVRDRVALQLSFLDGFRAEVQGAAEWKAGWDARAALYAAAVGAPYWKGAVRMLPLPFMPKDGTTQCHGNCRCSWRIDWVDEENDDADCYWTLSDVEHCQTCVSRAANNPYKVRGGVLEY